MVYCTSSLLLASTILVSILNPIVTAIPHESNVPKHSNDKSKTTKQGSPGVSGSLGHKKAVSPSWNTSVPAVDTAATYTFNATSTENIAVYFGRTNATKNTTLLAQCNDTNIDMVILAFATDVVGGGGYPDLSFDDLCSGQTDEMISANATGLLSCTTLAPMITECQSLGKKVLLGIGGSTGNTTFSSATAAVEGATLMWNIFGGGSGEDSGLRPFGDVIVDGFDIDNESGDGSYYANFTSELKTLYASQSSKTYYLSAAPSCYYPSDSEPLEMLNMVDFVWPQFYGAPSCNLGTNNFSPSFSSWSSRLTGPKLYIGATSFPEGATNGGYEDPDTFATTVKATKKSGISNFGGVMLWDGPYGHITTNLDGENFINVTKTALESYVVS